MLLRLAGSLASVAFWLGLVVVALNNLDTGLPRSEGLGGWPFFLVAVAITVAVAVYLSRRPGKPGWLHFIVGLLIPEVAFLVNRLLATEIGAIFWLAVAVLILIPLPGRLCQPSKFGA
ncbi:MAG TPA: hypothetical protein VJ796_06495 [Acidimicrobiia bacterium]|nr:hypothetical protein [Acidimicrobiia bacterium]